MSNVAVEWKAQQKINVSSLLFARIWNEPHAMGIVFCAQWILIIEAVFTFPHRKKVYAAFRYTNRVGDIGARY